MNPSHIIEVMRFFQNHKRSTWNGVADSLNIERKDLRKLVKDNFLKRSNEQMKDNNDYVVGTREIFSLVKTEDFTQLNLFDAIEPTN